MDAVELIPERPTLAAMSTGTTSTASSRRRRRPSRPPTKSATESLEFVPAS